MTIVENQQEIQDFLTKWNNERSIIIPIWEDLERHPMNNSLSFLYVYIGGDDFIIPFHHNDCQTPTIDLSESRMQKWIWNKKGFLQTNIQIQELKDVQTALFFGQNEIYDFQSKLEVLTNFYRRLDIRDDLGKSIPIMKWGEVLKGIVEDWGGVSSDSNNYYKDLMSKSNDWVENTMIPILSDIERYGVRVDRKKFLDRWKDSAKNLKSDVIYTEYNPYTITSRPSNRHGGINFSALNKKDGSRDCFIPREGKLYLQFDYDAYHVRIIGKIIGYDLPKTSVHQWLADQYGMDYNESKGRTFRILYGGVSDEDRKIPFFEKTDKFIQTFWESCTKSGIVMTNKRKIPLSYVEEPNPQKIFNYLLQSMETELNIEAMKKLKENDLPLPILYTYDSFLFEFDNTEIEKVKGVKSVLESFGFPVKADWGSDYGKI